MPNTLETFEQLIRHRTPQELLPFLLALDKSELVPVRQRTLSLEKELQASSEPTGQPEQTRSQLTGQRAYLLFLTGLATFFSKESRRLNPLYGHNMALPEGWPAQGEVPVFLAIIRHFRPAWLGEWLVRRLRADRWAIPQYSLLRELRASELIPYDPWLMAQSVAELPTHYNWRRNKSGDIPNFDQIILAELRADETLLRRDLPLLLDFDTLADTSSAWSGKERTRVTWQTLLAALLASGHLDRGEWLTHCLLALRRDFRRPLLTWIKNLYASLQPTPPELLARQSELRELLSHPLPLVVNFALDQLKEIWALPGFELAALLPPAEALLSRQDLKTGPRTLLTGLDRLLKADPAQAAPLARLYASALAHADAGVQERAAALPWLWAVAARTRQPAGEFPALAALTPPDCANVVRPCAMGWEVVTESLTRKITWKPGVTEETEHWLELQAQPLGPVAAPPTPVALYSLYPAAPFTPKYRWNNLATIAANYPYLATLLPHYPAPLHWRALTLATMHNAGESGPRDIMGWVLREMLIPGPAFDRPAALLLAVGLTHQQPPVRALALETLLAATDHGRLVPAALATALGKLLAAGFVTLPRLTAGLAQARAISARTDDALRQLLEALLPALPAAPPRQTGALLTLYADLPGRASHPVPAPVQARLREWGTSASLKKLIAPLLA